MKQTQIDEITTQCLNEIAFDRSYKQKKIAGWKLNEDLYYNKKVALTESRSNVNLARGQEFVHTLLSKIKNPSRFVFGKKKESQLQRVERLNILSKQDAVNDHWAIKDIEAKKQVIIYGRAISFYYADSKNGNYKPHLENCDVYDFLIDPSAGGIDIEKAWHLGRYGVVYSRRQLELFKKDKAYIKTGINNLLSGTGNNTDKGAEDLNKDNRASNRDTGQDKELQNPDKFKFWEWFTTYDGERYYVLLNEKGGSAIRIEKLTDMFSATEDYELGMWPCFSWAAYPDLTEFWSPSPLDYVRDILQAQDVSINQMLDNAEAVNKPQKAVQIDNIKNIAELKYRRDGIIRVKNNVNIDSAIKMLQVPSINTPIQVFEVLESLLQKSSGVTDGDKGVANENGRLGIYEGNQENSADRYGLIYDSYTMSLERFALLYQIGVRDHLTKKKAIERIGPNGVETEMISKRDIFKKGDEFTVLIEATNADKILSNSEQKAKFMFLREESQNPVANPKKMFELKAKIAGFKDEDIKEMLDTQEYGNASLMAECARDIESLLNNDKIKVNGNANNAYKQKMLNWVRDHEEDMDSKTFIRIMDYIKSLDSVIIRNETRAINQFEIDKLGSSMLGGAMGEPLNNNSLIKQNNGQIKL